MQRAGVTTASALAQSDYVHEYNEFIEGLKERASVMNSISIFNKEGGYASRNIEKTVNDFVKNSKFCRKTLGNYGRFVNCRLVPECL